MFNFSKSIKIGLALSGGGARAHVHLGMMQALLEKGFHFDVITGTSAGSLIGGLYANGYSPPEILEISQTTDFTRLARFALSWSGLLKLDSARKYLKKYLPETFEELQKPFIAAGTNMSSNQVSYLEKGPLIDAILASCCIPVIFKPVEIDEEQFVDGGITDNMPIIPLKERKVDYIIGLHCNQPGEGYKSKSWEELMLRSLHMSIASATYLQKDRVDLFLDPPAMAKYGVFDFKKAPEMYALGYAYAQEFLEKVDLPKKGWFK